MAVFELQGPDGQVYEVDAPDAKSAVAALSKMTAPSVTKNPDGTYGQAPEGFVLNPKTGQMEDLRSPNNPNVFTGRAAAVGLGAGQGLSYDMMDEAVGGARGAIYGDGEYSTALMRESDRRAKEDFPVSYGVPKVSGAILSSLGLGKALGITAAPTVAGRAMQGAGLGAFEGAMFGAGQGESLPGRALGALGYGAAGGVLGGAAPYAIEGAKRGIDALIGAPLASMRSAPSAVRASRAIETAVGRSGKSATELDDALRLAAREGQPEFAVADALGNPGQRMLSGISRTPNDARTEVVDFLTSRQDTQGERLVGMLDTAINSPNNVGKTAKEVTTGLQAARSAAADTAYTAARGNAAPVNLNNTIGTIDALLKRDPILGETSLSQGPIGSKLNALRARMQAGGEQLIDFDTVLSIKQDLFKQMQRGNTEPEIRAVYNALDAALENSSLGYRAANDGFREASKVIDSVDQGTAAASSRVRSQDVLNQYGSKTPAQQEAYRAGRIDPAIANIDSAAVGVNKARPFTSGKSKAEFGAMANDPAMLQRQIGRENTMFETANAALGGSKTSDNLADAADMQNFDYGVIANLFRGKLSSAMQQAIPTALNVLQGRNTSTRAEIARALLSGDIKAALKPAELARVASAPKSALAEMLVRSLMRLSN